MGILSSLKNAFSDSNVVTVDGNDEAAVREWLSQRLAKQLKIDVSAIDSAKPFEQYGLDSMFAVKVTGELEKVVEQRLSPALLFENTCIDDVARVIATSTQAA
ncbi:acyl carrier protein [Endozoicomonas acroporae]|uniref:acyl carrier protein n=1 Tax=Endozoicomonas acroporae TaxID=1701104 RepID=UPI003D7A77B3